MREYFFHLFVLGASFIGCSQALHTESTPNEPSEVTAETSNEQLPAIEVNGFYSVDAYDPARDASADLLATVEQAKTDNKRIILEIGGDW